MYVCMRIYTTTINISLMLTAGLKNIKVLSINNHVIWTDVIWVRAEEKCQCQFAFYTFERQIICCIVGVEYKEEIV